MDKVMLHSASASNRGDYLDAGTEVDVGEQPTAIHPDRAKVLVKADLAATVRVKPEPEAA